MVGLFEMFHARLTGVAHCIVPQMLPIPQGTILLQQPPIEFLQNIMLPEQIQIVRPPQPSIVQIVVPASSLEQGHVEEKVKASESNSTLNTTTSAENSTVEVTTLSFETSSHTLLSSSSTTPYPEDDIDEMILNEDFDGNYNEGNEENVKKQRDRSDFRYVESFEPEKSNVQLYSEPDPNEHEGENVINENFSQIPSVLPVPKALSSPELDEIPPDAMIQDESSSDTS